MQRDGHFQMNVPKGRTSYEPNSLEPQGPRESLTGFRSVRSSVNGEKVRLRPESFADHYSQARMFYRSVTEEEQTHIAQALAFELGKVEVAAVRLRMLGNLRLIDRDLGDTVADALGMKGEGDVIEPARKPLDLSPSPALRLYGRYQPSLMGRKVGLLLATGFPASLASAIKTWLENEGALPSVIALKAGGVADADGLVWPADAALNGSPSVLYEAVLLLAGAAGDRELAADADALTFLRDAYRHLKAIGHHGVPSLLKRSAVPKGSSGVVEILGTPELLKFVELAKAAKVWGRTLQLT